MPTIVHFVDGNNIQVHEDFQTVSHALHDQKAAPVTRKGSDRRLMIFAGAIRYIEERPLTE